MITSITDREATRPASTPCVKLCWLDPATGLCDGCGRTLDEIARWATLDETARRSIMAELPHRRARALRDAGPDGGGR